MLLHCVHNGTDPVDGVEHDEVEGVAVEVAFYQGEGVAGCHGVQHQLRAHLAHVRHLIQEPAHKPADTMATMLLQGHLRFIPV